MKVKDPLHHDFSHVRVHAPSTEPYGADCRANWDFSRISLTARGALAPSDGDGNRAVPLLLSGGAGRLNPVVQPSGGSQELEAERAADRVSGADRALSLGRPSGTETDRVPGPADSDGQPLDAAIRRVLESRLGHDFSHVRVHTGSEASRSAHALDASAFTLGHHIFFREDRLRFDTLRGARLVGHELAHVVQQGAPTRVPGGVLVQRKADGGKQEDDWRAQLDEILPGRVGLLTVIDRVMMLLDIFGETLLREHVKLIHADATATAITKAHGVPGVVALYDTRRGTRLDPGAAEQALKDLPGRYKRDALNGVRLAPRGEAPPSFLFQDPATQKVAGGGPTPGAAQRAQLHVEENVSQVGTSIFIRFAYPATEVSSKGVSDRIDKAKQATLQAIANLVADLGSLPPAADKAERQEQKTVRARLAEVLKGWSKTSPLHIVIATEPSPQELLSGQVAALTDRVYVKLADVGDPAQLQAAIRLPLLMLKGGILPSQKGAQAVPGASPAELKGTLLHEALHALLLRQNSDANAIWEANRPKLTVQGSPSVQPRFVELVRKFLIGQEELFAYDNEGSLYPPVSPERDHYKSFVDAVSKFLRSRRLPLALVGRSIRVSEKVAGKAVDWKITYEVPAGTVDLTINDLEVIDFLLGRYPLG